MRKFIALFAALLFINLTGTAQTSTEIWAIGAGINKVDFHGLTEGGADAFETMEFQGILGEFSLSRYLCPWANTQLTLGGVSFDRKKYDLPGSGVITSDELIFADLDAQLKFLSWVLDENSWFSPYIYAGLGGQYFNEAVQAKAQWGFGFDIWAFKNTGFYFKGDYSYPLDEEIVNYWHLHAGLKYKFGGQKDSDGDGIVDSEDKCPNLAGVPEAGGCPALDEAKKKEIDDQIRFSSRNIFFETNSDVILQESFDDLDNIVKIMNTFPSSRFAIEGHTDNTGGTDLNLKLSEKRAQSVKKYFINKGIKETRLDAKGYGESNPTASNDTPEGRALNRRVDIKLISQ